MEDLLAGSVPLDAQTLTIEEAGRLPIGTRIRVVSCAPYGLLRPGDMFAVAQPMLNWESKKALLTVRDSSGQVWYWTNASTTLDGQPVVTTVSGRTSTLFELA